jgi:hypothetical protein
MHGLARFVRTRANTQDSLQAGIVATGTARADLGTIAGLRKKLPAWTAENTAGHFLKHADEQTVVAVAAVDQAIEAFDIDMDQQRQWSIIAAPRFVGRLAGVNIVNRFARGGGPAVSPHVIPQHSLHSVSGALSVLLASRQVNFGVGGGREAIEEGLLAALTFGPSCGAGGMWFVATAWHPEPTAAADGQCTNDPVCHAFALALQPAAAPAAIGHIRLATELSGVPAIETPTVPDIASALDALATGGCGHTFNWRMSWGASLELEFAARASRLPAAA